MVMTTKPPRIQIKYLIGKGYNEFWHDKHFYRVVKGSRGSKKSRTTALNFIYRIMKYPWSNLLVVRRYSNTNHDSTYTVLKWAINRLGVSRLFKCNEGKPEITYLPTGQKIILRGLDDPLKVTSVDVDTGILSWAWFEEAYEIENSDKFETVVESIRGSLDDPYAEHQYVPADELIKREKWKKEFFKQITLTFNPWSERHWLKPMFFDPETRKPDVFARTTTFRVNEWLDKQDRKRYLDLYRTNPRRAQIVCDGNWGVAEGLVFENWVVEDFDVNKVVAESDGVGHGMDFGFTHDPTTFAEAAINRETKDIWIFKELYQKAMTTQDIFDWLDDNHYLKSDIGADCAEPRLIDELQAKGVRRMHASIKGPDSIDYGINFLQGYQIHILPSCVHAIEEFNTYVFDRDKDGNWLNKPVDANNHFIDSLRYGLEKYIIQYESLEKRFGVV